MNIRLLCKLKTRDAALVYEYLFETLNRDAQKIVKTSFDQIATSMTGAGLTTSRGACFTSAVVRAKVRELEELEIVEREQINGAEFSLFLTSETQPSSNAASVRATAPEQVDGAREEQVQIGTIDEPVDDVEQRVFSNEPAVPSDSPRRVHYHYENENENENEHEKVVEKVALNKENILNKKINKKVCFCSLDQERQGSPDVRERRENRESQAPLETDARPSTDDIRVKIDFSNPKIARFRSEIVRRVWERDVNPDLIDRLTALAVLKLGGLNASGVFALCAEARDAAARYERTEGRAGRPKIWHTLGYSCKRVYEASGWKWTRTQIGSEPKPEANATARAVAALMAD